MKVAIFSTKSFDREFLSAANTAHQHGHELKFLKAALNRETVLLASGFPVVCVFVNDELDSTVLATLAENGTKLVALRCAGFNNVDLNAAHSHQITVARVPAYSPYAVAEHTVGLILALNRHIHRAYARVREGNFELEGLMGFDLYERTIGIIGTGKIGRIVIQIMRGFGCHVLAYDPFPHPEVAALGGKYVELPELLAASDIISLHCPLTPETQHLINANSLHQMKDGVMIINTSRGKLVDTAAVIEAMKTGKVGYLGLDVYEEESHIFFQDLSERVIQDDIFSRLLTLPDVVITGHQGFFTQEALRNIAETTLGNISGYEQGNIVPENLVTAEVIR